MFQRTPWRKWKDNPQSERNIYKSYNWFLNLEYIKNAYNSMRQTTQLKNGQRIWIGSAPKIYECWICMWKDVQNYSFLGKYKSEPQWDATLCPLNSHNKKERK